MNEFCQELARKISSSETKIARRKKTKKVLIYKGEEEERIIYTMFEDGTIGTTSGKIVVSLSQREKFFGVFIMIHAQA